jgi:hypothetical protein
MPESFFFKDRDAKSFLIGISVCDISQLPKEFLNWDTEYDSGHGLARYELPKGKVIMLIIFTKQENSVSECWTTIRSWNPQKEIYYHELIGQEFKIEVEN